MLPIQRQYQLDELHRQSRMREAEQHELAQLAKQHLARHSRPQFSQILKPALYRLGKQLESIGNDLQVRYGDLTPRPTE